jgi:hypothetical protein
MEWMYLRGIVVAAALLGCGDSSSRPIDARTTGPIDGSRAADAASVDARMVDARMVDARMVDARSIDARLIDAPAIDAGRMIDARMVDARMVDARSIDARMIDARMVDARSIDARMIDARSIDAGGTDIVSCYTEGNPAQSCTLPTHCCFSNYSSQHDGFCSNNACIYGTITCDGPEDCTGGQHCCSHALFDSGGSVNGYSMACQASACGAAPANYELCHTDGAACSNGGTCVSAYLRDNDLPRTLDICQ